MPPELGELITRLTAKDPAARLSDAAEVAAIATRLRDALAADAGLTVAAPAFAGAAAHQAGAAMTGETALLDDQPLPLLSPLSPRQRGEQPDSPAGRPVRTGRRRATTLAAGVTVLAGAGWPGCWPAGRCTIRRPRTT